MTVLLYNIIPSVEIGDLRIDEPTTVVTDLLLAAICFYAFFRIRHLNSPGRIKRLFTYYFLTLGLGALSGGILGHAFLYGLRPEWQLVSWILIIISIAFLAHALLELAKPLVRPGLTRWIGIINVLILSFAIIYTVWAVVFSPFKYYTIFGMVVIVGTLSYYIHKKTGSKGVVRFMAAIRLGIISAFVFSYEWGVSPWFNHNDISHIILSIASLIIYKGAVLVLRSPLST